MQKCVEIHHGRFLFGPPATRIIPVIILIFSPLILIWPTKWELKCIFQALALAWASCRCPFSEGCFQVYFDKMCFLTFIPLAVCSNLNLTLFYWYSCWRSQYCSLDCWRSSYFFDGILVHKQRLTCLKITYFTFFLYF